jgi:hypothetical protein
MQTAEHAAGFYETETELDEARENVKACALVGRLDWLTCHETLQWLRAQYPLLKFCSGSAMPGAESDRHTLPCVMPSPQGPSAVDPPIEVPAPG